MKKEEIEALKALLNTPRKIAILGHKNPDGDALGSTLALSLFLKKQGHDAQVIVPNDFPDFLKWLPQAESILVHEKDTEKAEAFLNDVDLVFTLDFNSFSRVGNLEHVLQKLTTPFVMIDHHQQPDDYAAYQYSDVTICSTAQMVYHFIEFMDGIGSLDKDITTCIYTGIVTDTGSFRFRSTTSTTHHVAASLIDLGIDNAAIHQALFDNNSTNRMQLLGAALQNLVVLDEYKTAYITLSQKELDKYNFQKGDTEGFVNYALSIKNIVFAAIFIEHRAEKVIKISFRSIGDFSVNEFARNHFEGGGHNNAAGGRSNLKLNDTVSHFISKLQDYKSILSNA
ncbi:MAG: bifunctional oligoribonuclease/PAP phosphatase NrnA [Flavobacteriaceae bacterium]